MEQYSDNNNSVFEISFDERLKNAMSNAASWAGIAAILSLANSIVSLVQVFFNLNKLRNAYNEAGYAVPRQSLMSGMLSPLIGLGIAVVLFIFLLRFSRSTKQGIVNSDNYQLSEGLGGLSTYFKIIGILIIIGLSFVVLAVLFGIAAGL